MTSSELILCEVYKSGPYGETYLFVDRNQGLESVPDALKLEFADPILVTQFKLTPDRKMARANAAEVIQSIREKGFYLQFPPPKDPQLASIAAKNDKLPI